MKTRHLKFETDLPLPLAEAWDFFSSPLNLLKITPPTMKLVLMTDITPGSKIYPGMLISYKVSPLFGIPVKWVSKITEVKEMEYFIDEQQSGPYALWQHQHHFKEIKGGVRMTDILAYAMPYGILGTLVDNLVVGRKLNDTFAFRDAEVKKIFGVFKVK